MSCVKFDENLGVLNNKTRTNDRKHIQNKELANSIFNKLEKLDEIVYDLT